MWSGRGLGRWPSWRRRCTFGRWSSRRRRPSTSFPGCCVTTRGSGDSRARSVTITGSGWSTGSADCARSPARTWRPGRTAPRSRAPALPHRGRQPAGQEVAVICHNPEQADCDAAVRANLLTHLAQLVDGSDSWTARRRDELVGRCAAAGTAPIPESHEERAAPRRPGHGQTRGAPGRQVAAAHLRPHLTPTTSPPPTSSSCRSNAAGATSKAPSGCARCSITARTASAPTSNCAGSRCCSSA